VTYLGLAAIFVALTVPVLVVAVALRRPDRRWWVVTGLTALALVVLTAVFDSIMIAADLFRFDESALTGIHIGLAPIEDFAWPIAATVLISSLLLLADEDRR
jgi:lycopene cyclase domain-containing protein